MIWGRVPLKINIIMITTEEQIKIRKNLKKNAESERQELELEEAKAEVKNRVKTPEEFGPMISLPREFIEGLYDYLSKRPWVEVNQAVPTLEYFLKEADKVDKDA